MSRRDGKYTEIYDKYEKTRRDVVIISSMYSYEERHGLYVRNFGNGTNKVTCYY